ncbi:hypothetical protein B9Z55_007353 [Caenorhabditis nigoni]|uniref:F-box domain-containing protein n=1 Tax=Caenorhabditis nigoni TaxID=1611254 RepID=A0A2G5V9E8_9PELO|nr:hypothetical protein B9Z55_007353 [Caenorhabditis nigoni]
MKLFKFPYLVQKEILQNVKSSELFLMSFVSKKTKELIKSSQLNRFKNIDFIRYDCNHDGQISVYSYPRESWGDMLGFVERKEPHNDYFQLKVSGDIIDFRFSKRFKPLIVYFDEHDRESVIKSIHSYFLDFYGNSMKFQWIACDYQPSIPPLPNLSACFDMLITGWDFADSENLENFLSSCPVWKYINMGITTMAEIFRPESKLYQAESVKINQLLHTVPAALRYFQGKQAVITCGVCEIPDLIEFVNRWKSGAAFQKLEYLQMEIRSNEIPEHHLLDAIGAKYLGANRKPPTHTLPKVHVEDDILTMMAGNVKLNTDPITSYTYVVREADNCAASVLIQEKTFSFGVWYKTEEEFLRMSDKLQISKDH